MRTTTVYLLIIIGFIFTACDNAEISEVAPVKNENNSEFEKETHFPKDSIDNKTVGPPVNEPSKQVDFVKIPTH